MARISDMHKRWMKEPQYRKDYAALEKEFVLASAAIDARNRARLMDQSIEQMAKRLADKLELLEVRLEHLRDDFPGTDTRPEQAIVLARIEELTWVLGMFPS